MQSRPVRWTSSVLDVIVVVALIIFVAICTTPTIAFQLLSPPPSSATTTNNRPVTFTTTTTRSNIIATVATPCSSPSSSALYSARDRYFQLEEREHADLCITEILCHSNGTVTLLQTDGPRHMSASGFWTEHLKGVAFGTTKGTFEMTLKRTYPGGHQKSKQTDVGSFGYDVERQFTGEFGLVGGKLSVSGTIHLSDRGLGDEEVGFFEMIDTTEERSLYKGSDAPAEKIRLVPMGTLSW